ELGEAIRAPLPPRGEDHLGVALAAEGEALLLQLRLHLAVIVDLAIIGDRLARIGREHGLGAPLAEVDDGEAAMAEADAVRRPDAAAVGPAMGERVRHDPHPPGIDWLGNGRMEDAGDAAHASEPGGAVGEPVKRA